MASDSVEIEINAAPDVVWSTVGNFGGIGDYLEVIESIRLEGEDRIISMFGLEVRERLVSRDDVGRTLTYSVIDGVPIESHSATQTVHQEGLGSKVTWEFEVVPDEMAPIFVDSYKTGLAGLKAFVES